MERLIALENIIGKPVETRMAGGCRVLLSAELRQQEINQCSRMDVPTHHFEYV